MNPALEAPLFGGALVTGLLGAGHCIGMCGGLVAALSLASGRRGGALFHVLYNVGRTTTYVALGAAFGLIGGAFDAAALKGAGRYVLLGGDLFVILVGLGSAVGWQRLNMMRLDLFGHRATHLVQRPLRGLRDLPPGLAAYPMGVLMGFLPCGFLYAVLMSSALSGSAGGAAWVMLGFGLGTAPSLLVVGGATHLLSARARSSLVRIAGLAVALMGGFNLWRHLVKLGLVAAGMASGVPAGH